MVQLLDWTSLGSAPSGNSGRPISNTKDYSGEVSRTALGNAAAAGEGYSGLQHLGAGVEKVGNAAIDFAKVDQEDKDRVALTDAKSAYILNSSNLEQTLHQETDPANINKNFPAAFQTAADVSMTNLDDRQREMFKGWLTPQLQGDLEKVNKRSYGLQFDASKAADLDTRLKLADLAERAGNASGVISGVKNYGDAIDNAARKGFITPEEAVAEKHRAARDIPTKWLSTRSPDEILHTLRPANVDEAVKQGSEFFQSKGWAPHQAAGIMGHLLHESGGKLDPNAIARGDGRDGSDSIGIGQWNGQRAQQLKAFAAANGKPWNDLGVQLAFAQHEFQTTERGAADALKASRNVDEAVAAGLKYERPKGYEGGILTAAGGAQRLRYARQINGQLHEGALPPDTRLASLIPPTAQDQLVTHADNEIAKANHLAYEQQKAQMAVDNAVGSVKAGVALNPYVKDDKDKLDLAYSGMVSGGTDPNEALTEIVDKTKALPPSVASQIRQGVNSPDPDKVAQAAAQASNFMERGGNAIFDPDPGKDDINEAATKYRHYTDYMGMTAQEAGKRIVEERSPEYKQKIKAQADTYGFGKDILEDEKNGVLLKDLETKFGEPRWWTLGFGTSPSQVAFKEGDRQALVEDYKHLIRENFDNTGNYKLSRDMAQGQIAKVWGTSHVNGSPVAMRFAPENAPALKNIPDVSTKIGDQIVSSVKEATGHDIDRSKIILQPIDGGVTQRAYWNNQPPPYQVFWTDKNGIMQTINKPFVPDVEAMHKSAEKQFRDRQAAGDAVADTSVPAWGMSP